MTSLKRAAVAVAAILVREGIDYGQRKAVFKAARERAGLRAAPERRGGVDRLSVEEELRFLGHESIATTRLYAETTAATLQRRFDQLTDPAAHALVSGIRQRHGEEAALLAADLLAQRRAERVTTPAGA